MQQLTRLAQSVCPEINVRSTAGCEYGDRSTQCRDISPFDCYNDRNRQICCERCEQFRQQMPGQRKWLSVMKIKLFNLHFA